MGLFKNAAPVVMPGNEGASVKTSKEGKTRNLRVTIFPKEGGRPYTADVQPDEDGTFEVGEKMVFKVSRGSVWEEGGVPRAVVNEGNPQTINCYSLVGKDTINPLIVHGLVKNNLWMQLDSLAKRTSVWKQASTWGFLLLGVAVVLLLLWQINTLGSGLEGVKDALRGIQVAADSGGTPIDQSGHQPIAPRS